MLLLVGAGCIPRQQTPQNSVSPIEANQPPATEILANPALRTSFEEAARHSAIAYIAELSCFPTSRFDCTSDGCVPNAPGTYYFVDYGTDNGTYFRCDSKDCDSYPVKATPSGIYTQFSPSTGQAMLFKVTTDDVLGSKGEFVDVATIGTGTIVSFGKCDSKNPSDPRAPARWKIDP